MTKFNRRRFVTTGLSLGLFHPVFRSLSAQTQVKAPTRFVVYFTPLGTLADRFWPTNIQSPTQFDRPQLLEAHAPIIPDMTLLKGIDSRLRLGGHSGGMSETLTASEGREMGGSTTVIGRSISIDNYLAERMGGNRVYINAHPGDPKGNLGVLSWAGEAQPALPLRDPQATFNRFFADFVPQQNLSDEQKAELAREVDRVKALRGSVIDLVLEDYNRLYQYAGASEKEQLDRHITSLRELELSVEEGSASGITIAGDSTCMRPEAPGNNLNNPRNFAQVGRIQQEIMLQVLNCGLSRVGVFQWMGGGQSAHLSPLGGSHHTMSHDPQNNNTLVNVHLWYIERLVEFVTALKNMPDIDGNSVLDNTVILCVSDIADGQKNSHTKRDMPFKVIGGSNLGLTGGRILQFNQISHHSLLASVASIVGVPLNGFGNNMNSGTLPGLV